MLATYEMRPPFFYQPFISCAMTNYFISNRENFTYTWEGEILVKDQPLKVEYNVFKGRAIYQSSFKERSNIKNSEGG